jgi:hypothetical protein
VSIIPWGCPLDLPVRPRRIFGGDAHPLAKVQINFKRKVGFIIQNKKSDTEYPI